MGAARGIVHSRLGMAVLLCGLSALSGVASAQVDDDVVAREQFLRGRDAFDAAQYESALAHFKEAYRLSERGQLQYNIGVTASRLRRDEEALRAFQRYLQEVERPTREQEVRKRIAALEVAIEHEKEERARTLAEAMRRQAAEDAKAPSAAETSGTRRVSKSAIIGSSILGALGVAGVTTMAVSLARSGSCAEVVDGQCVSQRTTSAWTGVYGAIGIAALAGSATWLVVSSKRAKRRHETTWMLGPTGVAVSGSF